MGKGPNDAGASRGHLLDAAKASLKRLGVDHIDLYQIHAFDPATPMEETLRALDDPSPARVCALCRVSNWAVWQIAKALGISAHLGLSRFSSLQAYYSVAGRALEREIVPLLESEGVGLLVWVLSRGGLLTGKQPRGAEAAKGSRRGAVAFLPVNYDRAYDALDVMRGIAKGTRCLSRADRTCLAAASEGRIECGCRG
jgi:aryl-alcohol dehydrogenase-like predicted oxidoreductase